METKRIKISDTKNINDEEKLPRSYVTEVLLHFQQKLYMV